MHNNQLEILFTFLFLTAELLLSATLGATQVQIYVVNITNVSNLISYTDTVTTFGNGQTAQDVAFEKYTSKENTTVNFTFPPNATAPRDASLTIGGVDGQSFSNEEPVRDTVWYSATYTGVKPNFLGCYGPGSCGNIAYMNDSNPSTFGYLSQSAGEYSTHVNANNSIPRLGDYQAGRWDYASYWGIAQQCILNVSLTNVTISPPHEFVVKLYETVYIENGYYTIYPPYPYTGNVTFTTNYDVLTYGGTRACNYLWTSHLALGLGWGYENTNSSIYEISLSSQYNYSYAPRKPIIGMINNDSVSHNSLWQGDAIHVGSNSTILLSGNLSLGLNKFNITVSDSKGALRLSGLQANYTASYNVTQLFSISNPAWNQTYDVVAGASYTRVQNITSTSTPSMNDISIVGYYLYGNSTLCSIDGISRTIARDTNNNSYCYYDETITRGNYWPNHTIWQGLFGIPVSKLETSTIDLSGYKTRNVTVNSTETFYNVTVFTFVNKTGTILGKYFLKVQNESGGWVGLTPSTENSNCNSDNYAYSLINVSGIGEFYVCMQTTDEGILFKWKQPHTSTFIYEVGAELLRPDGSTCSSANQCSGGYCNSGTCASGALTPPPSSGSSSGGSGGGGGGGGGTITVSEAISELPEIIFETRSLSVVQEQPEKVKITLKNPKNEPLKVTLDGPSEVSFNEKEFTLSAGGEKDVYATFSYLTAGEYKPMISAQLGDLRRMYDLSVNVLKKEVDAVEQLLIDAQKAVNSLVLLKGKACGDDVDSLKSKAVAIETLAGDLRSALLSKSTPTAAKIEQLKLELSAISGFTDKIEECKPTIIQQKSVNQAEDGGVQKPKKAGILMPAMIIMVLLFGGFGLFRFLGRGGA